MSGTMFSGMLAVVGCVAWQFANSMAAVIQAVGWQAVMLADRTMNSLGDCLEGISKEVVRTWLDMSEEVRMGFKFVWWIMLTTLVGVVVGLAVMKLRGAGCRETVSSPDPHASLLTDAEAQGIRKAIKWEQLEQHVGTKLEPVLEEVHEHKQMPIRDSVKDLEGDISRRIFKPSGAGSSMSKKMEELKEAGQQVGLSEAQVESLSSGEGMPHSGGTKEQQDAARRHVEWKRARDEYQHKKLLKMIQAGTVKPCMHCGQNPPDHLGQDCKERPELKEKREKERLEQERIAYEQDRCNGYDSSPDHILEKLDRPEKSLSEEYKEDEAAERLSLLMPVTNLRPEAIEQNKRLYPELLNPPAHGQACASEAPPRGRPLASVVAEMNKVNGLGSGSGKIIREWLTEQQYLEFVRNEPGAVAVYEAQRDPVFGSKLRKDMRYGDDGKVHFRVKSEDPSKAGSLEAYTVKLDPGMLMLQDVTRLGWSCACKDFNLRGQGCKHNGAVCKVIREDGFEKEMRQRIAETEQRREMRTKIKEGKESQKIQKACMEAEESELQKTPEPVRARSPVRNSSEQVSRGAEVREAVSPPDSRADPTPGSAERRSKSATVTKRAVMFQEEEEKTESPGSSLQSPDMIKEARRGTFPKWSLLTATEAQQMAQFILLWIVRSCRRGTVHAARIWMLAFTFDRQDLVDGMLRCHEDGHQVKFGVDNHNTLSGTTRDQLSCVRRLAAGGVDVRMISGALLAPIYREEGRNMTSNWKGIQHCKVFYAEFKEDGWPASEQGWKRIFIHGSANWTLAARCNCEMSTITDLSDKPEAAQAVETMIEEYMQRGRAFDTQRADAAARARTASPVGRTQQRFNASRARERAAAVSSASAA